MPTLGIGEIMDRAADQKTVPEKVAYLRGHADNDVGAYFRLLFDPAVQWAELPEAVPYHPSEFPDSQGQLRRELKSIHKFLKGGVLDQYPTEHPRYKMQETNRVSQWIQLLERVHARDAEYINAARFGKLPKARGSLTKTMIAEAFPELKLLFGEQEAEK
jgi:hypothetical protein